MKKLLIGLGIIFSTSSFADVTIEEHVKEALVELGFEPTSNISLKITPKGSLLYGMLRAEKELTFGLKAVNINQFHSIATFKQNTHTVSCNIFYEILYHQLERLIIEKSACKVTTARYVYKK